MFDQRVLVAIRLAARFPREAGHASFVQMCSLGEQGRKLLMPSFGLLELQVRMLRYRLSGVRMA